MFIYILCIIFELFRNFMMLWEFEFKGLAIIFVLVFIKDV